MTVGGITVAYLKQVKNTVIGNPTAKRTLAKDEVFIGTLVNCVFGSDVSTDTGESPDYDLRTEAAHILASLSYGSAEALRSLLRANAVQALLIALSNFRPSEPTVVKAAFARALRTLASAVADAVGPSQWGLHFQIPDIQDEAGVVLQSLFQIDALDVYLPLLLDSSTQISISIAHLLAASLRHPEYRSAVSDWLPSSERQTEVKGKRGWEKADAGNSPSRQGGWVARQLVGLLQRKDVKLQEAALLALAALAKGNSLVATKLEKAPSDQTPTSTLVLSACKSRTTDLQVAACLCATNVFRAGNVTHLLHPDHTTPMTIIHVMNGLIEAELESPQTRTKACYILYYLVTDNKDLCQLAYERGSLVKLAQLVRSITPSEATAGWDEDEPESTSSLRAAALTTIAAMSMFDTDIRGEISGALKLVPYIQASLAHRHVGVRFAACQCVRALSRAVSVLRTNLVDSGLALAVFDIFGRKDEDPRVTYAASSVICNIVSDCSPLQDKLLEKGVIERLVDLLGSGDSDIITNALWAFKNLLYKSPLPLKLRVSQAVGWSAISKFLFDENALVQEQTVHMLRNIADGHEGIEMIFDGLGSEVLLSCIGYALESENEDVITQGVCLLGNISNSVARSHEVLANSMILQSLRRCLVDAKVDIRRPAVTCVLQLIKANPGSHKEFHDSGIDTTLRHMCDYGGGLLASSPTATFHRQFGVEDDREVKEKAREALSRLQLNFPDYE